MVKTLSVTAAAASILFFSSVDASIYSKSSPVLQVDAKTYPSLIANSNHTSVS